MQFKSKARWIVVGPVAIALTLALTAASGPVPPCETDRAVAWIQTHHDSLPTTLAGLERYPAAYRRVIMSHLPSDVRVNLWNEHLTAILATDPSLSPTQRKFLEKMRSNLSSYVVDRVKGREQLLHERANDHIIALFGRQRGAAIFATIGREDAAIKSRAVIQEASMFAPIMDLASAASRVIGGGSAQMPACNCYTGFNGCAIASCKGGGCYWDQGQGWCGIFGSSNCDGLCTAGF